jgi:hypothetical protein
MPGLRTSELRVALVHVTGQMGTYFLMRAVVACNGKKLLFRVRQFSNGIITIQRDAKHFLT